jgi:hypothetical protein
MEESGVSSQMVDGNLQIDFRPKTSYGRFVGPAMGDGFSVNNPGISIEEVVDHQDGSYTITFSGNIEEDTKLQLLGQEIYEGALVDIAKTPSFIEKIVEYLKSLGLPMWLIWIIIILIILLILWRLIRRRP